MPNTTEATIQVKRLDDGEVCVRLGAFLAAIAGDPETTGASVAVVGTGGELIAFGSHASCPALPRLLAVRKAFSAMLFRRSTAIVSREVSDGVLNLSWFHDERILAMPGGTPIRGPHGVIGGVGVSGLPPARDVELAERFAAELTAGQGGA